MSKKNIEAIYPLSSTQQGMLFETVLDPCSGVHIEQLTCALRGELNISAFEEAWKRAIARHSTLRCGFVWKEQPEPLMVVLRQVEIPLERQDWRNFSEAEQQEKLPAFLETERQRGFDVARAPLMRAIWPTVAPTGPLAAATTTVSPGFGWPMVSRPA